MIHRPRSIPIQPAGVLALLELIPSKPRAFAVFGSNESSSGMPAIDADGLKAVAVSVGTSAS
jgi:hypothetical protein